MLCLWNMDSAMGEVCNGKNVVPRKMFASNISLPICEEHWMWHQKLVALHEFNLTPTDNIEDLLGMGKDAITQKFDELGVADNMISYYTMLMNYHRKNNLGL